MWTFKQFLRSRDRAVTVMVLLNGAERTMEVWRCDADTKATTKLAGVVWPALTDCADEAAFHKEREAAYVAAVKIAYRVIREIDETRAAMKRARQEAAPEDEEAAIRRKAEHQQQADVRRFTRER